MSDGGRAFLGAALAGAGSLLAIFSFNVPGMVPFTAMGVAMVVVGMTAAALREPKMGTDFEMALLKGSMLGIEPLLNEIYAKRSKVGSVSEGGDGGTPNQGGNSTGNHPSAIYLPPKGEGAPVYVPLDDQRPLAAIEEMGQAPTGLLPSDAHQRGIRVFSAGSSLVGVLGAGADESSGVEEALRRVLVEEARLCSSVKAVKTGNAIVVEMRNARAGQETESHKMILGSLPTSLAASVVATVTTSPVAIEAEEITLKRTIARLSFGADKAG